MASDALHSTGSRARERSYSHCVAPGLQLGAKKTIPALVVGEENDLVTSVDPETPLLSPETAADEQAAAPVAPAEIDD